MAGNTESVFKVIIKPRIRVKSMGIARPVFMATEIERNVPQLGEMPPWVRDG